MKTKIIKVGWFKANIKGYVIHQNKVWNIINIVDNAVNNQTISEVNIGYGTIWLDGTPIRVAIDKQKTQLYVVVECVMSVRKLKKLIFEKVLTDQKIIEEIVLKDKDFGEVIEDIAFEEASFLYSYNKNQEEKEPESQKSEKKPEGKKS